MAVSFFLLLTLADAAVSGLSMPVWSQQDSGISRRSTGCQNGPTSRRCWGEHDIDTNYYDTIFYTNHTVEYWLSLEEVDCAPDGYLTKCQTANGTMPGPPIVADWGDEVVIHVTNNIPNNGSAIHWHGVRQHHNSAADGVPGVSQCPIAPNTTLTYKFHADQYGTTWYHSHFSIQYSNGLYGPLIINGPATADYDEDLGSIFITDWDHETADYHWATVGTFNVSFNGSDTGLFNGLNTGICTLSNDTRPDPNCLSSGRKFELNFEAGKKYRLRVLNVATEDWAQFSIDNHTMTVIASDFVPIKPYEASSIYIDMGQRYDVVIEANAPPGNYWMRSGFEPLCIPNKYGAGNITAIVRYDNASTEDPGSDSVNGAITGWDLCVDEQPTNLEPWVPVDMDMSAIIGGIKTEAIHPEYVNNTYLRWLINDGGYMWVDWANPALKDVLAGNYDNIPSSDNVFYVGSESTTPQDGRTEWVVVVVEDKTPFTGISHPIHLHGHDFLILSTGYEPWNGRTHGWQLQNPPRRDTATMPSNGYLAIAWPLDNAGVWVLHCHLAWHSSQGFGATVVESAASISSDLKEKWNDYIDPVCATWNDYLPTAPFHQVDSGI